MIRALFVTHDISIYGASKSLQTLLKNYSVEGIEIDLVINHRLLRDNDLEAVRKSFGPYVKNIYEFYLPFELCEVGKAKPNLGLSLKNFLSRFKRGSFTKFVREKGYDVVYLNSLVLHSMVTRDIPYLIHVREIYDFSQASVYASLDMAKGIIFIDESTEAPFDKKYSSKSIVLNNPFDMREIVEVTGNVLPYQNDRRTVIAMIGKIKDSKGNLFVLNSFINSKNNKNALLLFVGDGDDNYLNVCKKAAAGHDNVVFLGEEPEIARIYKVSDFIIRGEATPAIGRTIYEGLYSGSKVIIPGNEKIFGQAFSKDLVQSVNYYEPRDQAQLTSIFDSVIGSKVYARKYTSNASDYVKTFHSFLVKTINNPAK